jgi:MFS family permease
MAVLAESDTSPVQPQPEGSALKRRLAFVVVLFSAFGTSLVYSVVQPILPILAAHFGGGAAGEHFAQMAATAPAMGMLVGGLVGGWLIALVGNRPVILSAILLMGVLGVAEAFLPDARLFLADRAVLGLGSSLLGTACVTLLGGLYEGEARDRAVGILQGVATFGAVPTVIAVGVLAATLGWRAPFGFFVRFAAPAFVMAVIAIDKGRAGAADAAHGVAGGMSAMRLWPVFLFVFAASLLNTMGVAQLPFLLKQEGVSGAAVQGIILSSNALVMGVGAVGSARFQNRVGERAALVASVIVAGVGNIVVGLSHSVWLSGAGSVFSYLGLGVLLAMSYTLVLNRARPEERGVAVGYTHAAMFIGQFANPLILAPINAAVGHHTSYVGVGVTAIVLALLGGALARRAPARA